ncbi:hypothetical protein [Bacteroides sp.]|uniref:hypothetical protein n=1 Tax=Bacteroides sp. TaxID=29523 RepID=UPI0025C11B39|nr:hypothetical protein [Bacteroides sp.]
MNTVTKDHIVSINRDKEAAQTVDLDSENIDRRLFSKAPHHIFVYDYEFNLVKIVDVCMSVFKIAADCSSNKVFLIGANPDFCIGTFAISQ